MIETFVQQREIVNQHRYEENLDKYREAKAKLQEQQLNEQQAQQSIRSSKHKTTGKTTNRRGLDEEDDVEEVMNEMLDQVESNESKPQRNEQGPLKEPIQLLQQIKTSEYREEIADDLLEFVKEKELDRRVEEPEVPVTPRIQLTVLTFDDFRSLVLKWYKENDIPSVQEAAKKETLEAKLAATIREYEAIRTAKADSGEDISSIDVILKTLKAQLAASKKRSEAKPIIEDKQFWDTCRRNLHEAFVFYAKQQKLLGLKPSFDEIQRNLTILNVGKFLRFFRDFGLMEKKKETDTKKLERKVLIRIFMKHSIVQKEMEEESFIKAIDAAAEAYFGKRDAQSMPIEDKRKLFYKIIEADNFEAMQKKFKGFGKPFGSNTDNRIPENDLAKRYKYKQYNHQRMSVEEFKKLKAAKVQESPRFEHVHKAPADAIVSYQNPTKVTKADVAKKGRNPYTWQGLGDMQPEQLKDADDDFDIKDLIVEDSSDEDEYLAKQFPISPRQDEVFITATKHVEISPKQEKRKPKSLSVTKSVGKLAPAKMMGNTRSNANLHIEQPSPIVTKTLKRTRELEAQAKKAEDASLGRAMKMLENQESRAKLMKSKFAKVPA
mmetsp:Transcript_23252/g.41371  ORF Transcript_23252/g.41371 Transcript_23252/m.41371 type:complete len:606 (-) Transcript_23252:906-2723(-)